MPEVIPRLRSRVLNCSSALGWAFRWWPSSFPVSLFLGVHVRSALSVSGLGPRFYSFIAVIGGFIFSDISNICLSWVYIVSDILAYIIFIREPLTNLNLQRSLFSIKRYRDTSHCNRRHGFKDYEPTCVVSRRYTGDADGLLLFVCYSTNQSGSLSRMKRLMSDKLVARSDLCSFVWKFILSRMYASSHRILTHTSHPGRPGILPKLRPELCSATRPASQNMCTDLRTRSIVLQKSG